MTETTPPQPHQRIARAIARAGLCSRREAESWIEQGRVSLNGAVCSSPAIDVRTSDIVLVDGVALPAPEKTRLFLFHKPRGLITSDHDPEGRPTVTDFLKAHWPEGPRVVTIGRLDINTEGLLLLTNDGGLARVLELPRTGWVRRYRVRAKGATDQAQLDALAKGVSLAGIDYAGVEATLDRVQGANCWLTMGLREGKNREVKRILEDLGLEVNRLIRLSFGPFQLLDLQEGAVEEVSSRVLRDQLGDALAAKAGVMFEPAADAKKARDVGRPPAPDRPERRSSNNAPRPEQRPRIRQRPENDDQTRPRPGRPTAGKRKHVSTLRTENSTQRQDSPRKRIDRSDTVDRRDRTVRVERIVLAESKDKRIEPRQAPSADARERPRRRSAASASPSALAKRERIARSGGKEGAPKRPERQAAGDRNETRRNPQKSGRPKFEGRTARGPDNRRVSEPRDQKYRPKKGPADPERRAERPRPKTGSRVKPTTRPKPKS